MAVVRIEHSVHGLRSLERGVRQRSCRSIRHQAFVAYRVLRGADDPDYVMIDLEFGTVEEARALVDSCG